MKTFIKVAIAVAIIMLILFKCATFVADIIDTNSNIDDQILSLKDAYYHTTDITKRLESGNLIKAACEVDDWEASDSQELFNFCSAVVGKDI